LKSRNLFDKKLKIFLDLILIYAIFKTMRQGKKERLKQKAKKTLRNNLIVFATSSVYSPLGVSLYGLNDSKYHYIKENQENRLIAIIDKKNKKRLDRIKKVC
tara:strand:- start:2 stop:307 length:306 start_codon:yes stop_codon:yes gene_type:complete